MQMAKMRPRGGPRRVPPPPGPVTIHRLWPGSTVVCLATGPSLTQADVDFCYGRARVIAINDAYKLAPWADALYACDSRWWHWHKKGVATFAGQKYSIDPQAKRVCPDLTILRNTGERGLELSPTGLRTGKNSGYQAMNLAVHLGAARIVMLGYDMRPDGKKNHFFGEHPHPVPPPYRSFIDKFSSIVEPLAAHGIEVVNCSRRTALECFPRRPLEEVLGASTLTEAIA